MRRFLIYSNLHIPVLAAGLLLSTAVLLRIKWSLSLIVAASAGAFLVYQIDRIWVTSPEDRVNQPERTEWYEAYRFLNVALLVVAIVLTLIAIYWMRPRTLLVCLIVGLVGIGYLMPYGRSGVRFKKVWFWKPLLITTCWGFGGVLLPALDSGEHIDGEVWSLFFYRSFLILSNVILADLPDRKGDETSDLFTMAVRFPVQVLTRVALLCAASSFFIGLFHGITYSWEPVLFVDLVGPLCMYAVAWRAHASRAAESHLLYSYVVDLIIAWPLVSVALYYVSL